MKLWNLPKEFEMVCRDLWALHLSLLPELPPSEPYLDLNSALRSSALDGHTQIERTSPSRHHSRSRTRSRPHSPETRPSSPLPSDSPSPNSSSDSEDDSETQQNEEDVDFELAELMRENSESEDDDGELGDDDNLRKGKPQEQRRRHGHNAYEGPANNLAVLMVALWTLRIPVMYRDLIRHIELYQLPYLDPIRLLPADMVSHFTKHNIQALSPAHPPKTLTLHVLTSRIAKQLYSSYTILTPEANAAPMLWRIIQGMGGTPTLYALTKRLSHKLSLPLALHKSLAPKLLQVQARDPQTHKLDNAPVEASLLAAVIVVLKLVYGLDGERRFPNESDDPAFALPCVEDYLGHVRHLLDADPRQEAVFNSENPVSMDSVNDDILDEYLAFCEHALLKSLQDEGQMVANHFPLGDSSANASMLPTHVTSVRSLRGQSEPSGQRRPGEKYTIFHSRDIFGTVPEGYKLLVKRGSDLIGISEDYIDGLVEKFERRNLWKK
ncbi:hypothetical protein GYMLUDRAFT_36871 [Collybiopsis luxurians FD-317 M1]|nr:hypothetical protein GYMLUDRAFT_36871 [Collybiopsis luxurians FD-317 M1]